MKRILVLLISLAVLTGATLPVPASGTVPPRTCKTLTVKGKRFQIKADQVRCPVAERYARTYLERRRAPRGFTCRRYDSRTKLAFRCQRSRQVIFAIRR